MREVNLHISRKSEWVNLSVDATPSASMTLRTTSGMPYVVDWRDGTIDVVNSNVLASHTYTSPFTGNVRVSAFFGVSDIYHFSINNDIERWSFDADVLSAFSLTYLRLTGNSLTGDMSGVSNLTSLTYLYLFGNSFTGDMSGVSNLTSLDYFSLTGDFTINYTSTTFAPNFQRWLFRPTTATNPMSSSEIDQMLADAAQTTWTGEKNIYVDGNNGVRTSASDADVVTLQAMGVTLYLNV